MNTKFITVLLILLVGWVGYRTYVYYVKVNQENTQVSPQSARRGTAPGEMPALPYNLQITLDTARRDGSAGLKQWLQDYGSQVQDPNKAAIELEYCASIMRLNPQEARRVFEGVKQRTRPSSPVYAHVKEFEKSFK